MVLICTQLMSSSLPVLLYCRMATKRTHLSQMESPDVLPTAAFDQFHRAISGGSLHALQVAALTDALQRSQTEVAELQHLQQSTAQQAAESAAEVRRLGGAVQQATASNAAELRAQEEQGAVLREETRKRQVGSSKSLAL